jgi:hypothetical protein
MGYTVFAFAQGDNWNVILNRIACFFAIRVKNLILTCSLAGDGEADLSPEPLPSFWTEHSFHVILSALLRTGSEAKNLQSSLVNSG